MGQNRRDRRTGIILLCILIISGCFYALFTSWEDTFREVLKKEIRPKIYLEEIIQEEILKTHMPSMLYLLDRDVSSIPLKKDSCTAAEYLWEAVIRSAPVLAYARDEGEYETQIEDEHAYDAIQQCEGADEEAERTEEIPIIITPESEVVEQIVEENTESHPEKEREPLVSFSLEELQDFTYLLSHFYTVDKATSIDADRLSAATMLEQDMHLEPQTKEEDYQILIYHTHSEEGYIDSIPGDEMTTVVGVGARLTELLTERGYAVLHHRGKYDLENRDYAYANAELKLMADRWHNSCSLMVFPIRQSWEILSIFPMPIFVRIWRLPFSCR